MSICTAFSVESFLSNLKNAPLPKGKLEVSEASHIETKFGVSEGKKTDRLSFDELNEDCFKVAARRSGCFLVGGRYQPANIELDGQSEVVLVNIKSMMKRFGLPRDVVFSNLFNLGKIVRLVKEKQLFQASIEKNSFSVEEDSGIPLLSINNRFSSLIPLEQIAKMADQEGRCFRLSKRCYQLARSVDVYPGGFIAVDTGEVLGKGSNAKVKLSKTLQGVGVARRAMAFSVSNFRHQALVLRLIKIADDFKGKTGILETVARGVYENKKGRCKFVSFHPLYDQDLNKFLKNRPSEKNRLKMAGELLEGLNAIAEKGAHRDIAYRNILLRTKGSFEAVIADFDYFRYQNEEGGDEINSDVWNFGNVLYYVLQANFIMLPWDKQKIVSNSSVKMRTYSGVGKLKISQKDLDKSMKASSFPPELESLLRGMLDLDPKTRWTANQSLEHFKKYLLSKEKKEC